MEQYVLVEDVNLQLEKYQKKVCTTFFFGEKMKQYRQYEKFEECSKCKLKNFCRGCPSVAKCLSGNFYGKDPQCWKTIE